MESNHPTAQGRDAPLTRRRRVVKTVKNNKVASALGAVALLAAVWPPLVPFNSVAQALTGLYYSVSDSNGSR